MKSEKWKVKNESLTPSPSPKGEGSRMRKVGINGNNGVNRQYNEKILVI